MRCLEPKKRCFIVDPKIIALKCEHDHKSLYVHLFFSFFILNIISIWISGWNGKWTICNGFIPKESQTMSQLHVNGTNSEIDIEIYLFIQNYY